MAALAIVHREEIIEKLSQGKFLKNVAAELNTTPSVISDVLHSDPVYKKARKIGAEVRLSEQYQAIESAPDMLSVARAREGFRAAAWFAEREFPETWGQKQEITHNLPNGPLFSINVVANTPMVQCDTPELPAINGESERK